MDVQRSTLHCGLLRGVDHIARRQAIAHSALFPLQFNNHHSNTRPSHNRNEIINMYDGRTNEHYESLTP